MVLITWQYNNKQFYREFALSTHFHDNYLKSINMNPEKVTNVLIVAKGRTSYPDKKLMVA